MKKNLYRFFAAAALCLALAVCLSCTSFAASYKNEIVTEDGKQYYYNKSGKLVKGKYGYKIGKSYYRISKSGVLKKVSRAEGLAGIQLNAWYKKSKSQALWQAFQWSAKLPYYTNSTKAPSGQSKRAYFGQFGFQNRRGDCNVQAATFYWMAKVLGYDVKFVQGYVPTAQDASGRITKYGAHAWTTIKLKGKTYVYDPNFSGYCTQKHMLKEMKSGYKITYGAKNTYRYFSKKKKELR